MIQLILQSAKIKTRISLFIFKQKKKKILIFISFIMGKMLLRVLFQIHESRTPTFVKTFKSVMDWTWVYIRASSLNPHLYSLHFKSLWVRSLSGHRKTRSERGRLTGHSCLWFKFIRRKARSNKRKTGDHFKICSLTVPRGCVNFVVCSFL